MSEFTTEDKLAAALHKNERLERKAAKANLELEKIRQENARLRLENKIQLGWLDAVLAERFPEKYGQPGAYNWFGTRP